MVQAEHELLRELGEPSALPSARLRGVEVELARGVVLVLWRGRRGRGKDGTMSGRPEQKDEKEEEINNLYKSVNGEVINLESGDIVDNISVDDFDQRKSSKDPKYLAPGLTFK